MPRLAAALWGFARGQKDGDEDARRDGQGGTRCGRPAAAGGLKAGDRLLTLDGRWTDSLGGHVQSPRAS